MAKKSLTGKRYFEWLGREHERQGFREPIFYDFYEHRIRKWPIYAQQAYRIARNNARMPIKNKKPIPDKASAMRNIYYRVV